MSSLEEIKFTLRPRWLKYYQANRIWLKFVLDSSNRWITSADGGQRPPADLIIGAISAIEPRLAGWLLPLCELNADGNKLVEVLGLNFDPERELEKAKTTPPQNLPVGTTFYLGDLEKIYKDNQSS